MSGWLAVHLPSFLLAQALSPTLGAVLIGTGGPDAALGLLAVLACLNLSFVGLLGAVSRPTLAGRS